MIACPTLERVPVALRAPDPKVQFGYQRMPMMEPVQGAMYGIGQEIPFPGKLQLKGEVAQREADRIEQEYVAVRLRLVARLKEAYYDLHFVHDAIEVVERNKALLMQFGKTAKSRYAVGQAAQQDVFRAQVEISRVMDRLAVLDQQKESLHAAINRLLNRPPDGPFGAPDEIHVTMLTLSLSQLNQRALDVSPILHASAKGVERGEQASSTKRPWKRAPADSLRLKSTGAGFDRNVRRDCALPCDDITSAGRPYVCEFSLQGQLDPVLNDET